MFTKRNHKSQPHNEHCRLLSDAADGRRVLTNTLLMATVAVQGMFSVNHVCADEPVHKELPAVSRFVTCNGHCFVINGQPTYLFMGQMEYLHIPRELWRD